MVFPINLLSVNTQRIKANSVPSWTTPYLNHCCPAGSPQSCRECDLVNKWAMQSMGSIPCISTSFLSLFQTQSALHGENLGSDVSWTPELTKNQRLNLIPVSQWLCCRFLSQVKRSTCNTVESHWLQGNITSLHVAAGLEGLELDEPLLQLLVLLDGCFPSCCAKLYSLGKRKQLKPPSETT